MKFLSILLIVLIASTAVQPKPIFGKKLLHLKQSLLHGLGLSNGHGIGAGVGIIGGILPGTTVITDDDEIIAQVPVVTDEVVIGGGGIVSGDETIITDGTVTGGSTGIITVGDGTITTGGGTIITGGTGGIITDTTGTIISTGTTGTVGTIIDGGILPVGSLIPELSGSVITAGDAGVTIGGSILPVGSLIPELSGTIITGEPILPIDTRINYLRGHYLPGRGAHIVEDLGVGGVGGILGLGHVGVHDTHFVGPARLTPVYASRFVDHNGSAAGYIGKDAPIIVDSEIHHGGIDTRILETPNLSASHTIIEGPSGKIIHSNSNSSPIKDIRSVHY